MNYFNFSPGQKQRTIFLFLAFALICLNVPAQPPALMNYQGRLTDANGNPLTGSQTVYFSLWQEGAATAAGNTGDVNQTRFYSEQAAVQPDNNGVFDHQIGTGTNQSGQLTPDQFNTTKPVFLQVAVGSTGNVLLPRT